MDELAHFGTVPAVHVNPGHSDRAPVSDALALALSVGLPYCGLRGFEPDPRLFSYLPPDEAARARLVPLMLVADTLRVASPTPEADISYLRQRFPNLEIELVIAPADEVDQVLAMVTTGEQ